MERRRGRQRRKGSHIWKDRETTRETGKESDGRTTDEQRQKHRLQHATL